MTGTWSATIWAEYWPHMFAIRPHMTPTWARDCGWWGQLCVEEERSAPGLAKQATGLEVACNCENKGEKQCATTIATTHKNSNREATTYFQATRVILRNWKIPALELRFIKNATGDDSVEEKYSQPSRKHTGNRGYNRASCHSGSTLVQKQHSFQSMTEHFRYKLRFKELYVRVNFIGEKEEEA